MPDCVDLLFFVPSDEESSEEILRKDTDKAATEICCSLEQRIAIMRHHVEVVLPPQPLSDEVIEWDSAHGNSKAGEAGDQSQSDLRVHCILPAKFRITLLHQIEHCFARAESR